MRDGGKEMWVVITNPSMYYYQAQVRLQDRVVRVWNNGAMNNILEAQKVALTLTSLTLIINYCLL